MQSNFSAVAVVGLGTVGSGLAARLADAGLRVTAVESSEVTLARGREHVARARAAGAAGDFAQPALGGHIEYGCDIAAVAGSDLVIEAVPERLTEKKEVLSRAHAVCGPKAIFATTTTALPLAEIAAASGRPSRLVGWHPVSPEPDGTVYELTGTGLTDPAALKDVKDLIQFLGCSPVEIDTRSRYIAGALLMSYLNGAVAMYEQCYATRDDIDTAMMLGCGLPLGPLAQLDAIGLDVALDALTALYEGTGDRQHYPQPLLAAMVSAGTLGRKAGRGFYSYDGEIMDGAKPGNRQDRGQALRVPQNVGVVGSGVMATGIAEVCVVAGHPTVLLARTEDKAKDALATVTRSLQRAVRRGRLAPERLGEALARLECVCEPEAVAGSERIIEAITEELQAKRECFRVLDRACPAGVLFATSTSSLPVIECASATGRPEDFVGLHFFNPAPAMKLVEITRTALTSADTLSAVSGFCTAAGKRPVNCTDRTGFIVNALLFPYLNGAARVLDGGCVTADDLDTVFRNGRRHPMGPIELLDVVGLDIALAIQRRLHENFGAPHLIPARSLETLVENGHLGRKSGRGFRQSH
jgi:3-hydroxybutyryl-CoA dehydrogenase